MASSSSLLDYRAYHILSYGSLYGTTFFQSFVAGVVAFRTLPRSFFGNLQEATTPIFFALQTFFAFTMALTYPGDHLVSPLSTSATSPSGLRALLNTAHRWNILLPMATIFSTSALNLLVFGPATTKTMKIRRKQESTDGKKSYDEGPKSAEMQKLNKRFALLHSASTILDLLGFAASTYYGFVLGKRL